MADEISTVANFLKDYGTLIAIPAATLVGSLAYVFQKYTDRKSALVELRRETYSKYLSLVSRSATSKTAESTNELYGVYMEMSVIASDEVVRAIGPFHRSILGTQTNEFAAEKIKELFATSILSMRKDCFEKKSNLTREEALSVTPLVDHSK